MRQHIDLDGAWDFQIDPTGALTLEQIPTWRTIQVPGPWQAQFDDLRSVAGVGWYRRNVFIPAEWAGRAVFLRFGAVDYFAEVWVNGQRAGEHEGGYLPFEFNVSALARYGAQNAIVVRVVDPGPGAYDIFPAFPFGEIPHGKQSWYGPVGGLWQSVWLEACAPRHIAQVHVTPAGLSGRVSAAVRLAGAGEASAVRARCKAPQGAPVASVEAGASPQAEEIVLTFTVPDVAVWDLDAPALYTLEVELWAGGAVIDRQEAAFGFRTFEARDGQLWLNGRRFYMRGALDQDYYPEGIYTPPSLDFLRAQMRQAKAMGLNCLRCHIKAPDPRYLQAADEVGILVWMDVPNWSRLTEAAGRRARATFAGMVARDWNHPSLVMWSLVNEGWGTDLPGSEADRRWLLDTFAWAKQVDPHRVIVDNSPCIPNFHLQTDVDDYHFYAAMPDNMEGWRQFVTHFARRAPFTFSPNDDALRTGQEPLVVSEFGNWGLPDIEQLKRAYGGAEPWWFATGENWGPGVVFPRGAEARLRAAGLEAVFGDWSGLAEAAQWAQYRALKHEVEVMRAEPALSGYVITELTDLHWESNGLMDMARNPRVFADRMAQEFNADTVIIPRWERLAYWEGEPVRVEALVSHFGAASLENATLRWALEGHGVGGALGPLCLTLGDVHRAGTIAFTAPAVRAPEPATLALWLERPGGATVARNVQPLNLFPAGLRDAPAPRPVWADDPALAGWLAARGYRLSRDAGVRVVSRLDAATLRHVRAGGRALCVALGEGPVGGLEGVRVEARQGTPWAGDWASSFAWVRPGVTRLPGGPLLDFGWGDVIPRHVITGVEPAAALAGLFVGWVHMPAALIAPAPLGAGSLLLTTFPVLPPDDAPARAVLLHDLIRATQP